MTGHFFTTTARRQDTGPPKRDREEEDTVKAGDCCEPSFACQGARRVELANRQRMETEARPDLDHTSRSDFCNGCAIGATDDAERDDAEEDDAEEDDEVLV